MAPAGPLSPKDLHWGIELSFPPARESRALASGCSGPLCLSLGGICPWARVPRASVSSAVLQRPHHDRHSCRGCVPLPIPPALTLCGARSSRWTPANWVPRARSSRNVNSGGRLGSGKLVLLKGSVSSKNCTRQASVAMMHPCPVGRRPRGQRAAQAGVPGLCRGEAAAAAATSRLAGSLATARPAAARTPATGGGAGAGLRPLLLPLLLGLLPCSVYQARDRASPTFATAAGARNERATSAASAVLSLSSNQRAGTSRRRAFCTRARRPGSRSPALESWH